MAKFEIPIVYRGQCNYIVEANTEAQAMTLANERFMNGDPPDELGNEWEEIERWGEIRLID